MAFHCSGPFDFDNIPSTTCRKKAGYTTHNSCVTLRTVRMSLENEIDTPISYFRQHLEPFHLVYQSAQAVEHAGKFPQKKAMRGRVRVGREYTSADKKIRSLS